MTGYGNHAQVGFAMIVVSATLAVIGLLALAIGDNVLFSDNMQRANTAEFNECKENDFKLDGCEKYWDRINSKISGIFVDLDK